MRVPNGVEIKVKPFKRELKSQSNGRTSDAARAGGPSSAGRAPDPQPVSPAEQARLDEALRQSKDVKVRVDTVAEDLKSSNEKVKDRLAQGARTVPAKETLADGERAESSVKQVSNDLHEVNEVFANGIDHLRDTERALADTQLALLDAEAGLSAAQEAEQAAITRALHDAATGLPNRVLFEDRMTTAISLAERHDWTLAVMFVDLDRFKAVNDVHGHSAGDAVLKEVARRLAAHTREEDSVCRNGGDEFLLLLINPQGLDNVLRIAAALSAAITEPIVAAGVSLTVGASLGIACFPDHGRKSDQLIARADAAMYRAKRSASDFVVWSGGSVPT